MNGLIDKLMDKEAMDFIAKIEDAFKNLPHLPNGLVEFLVKIAPWLALLSAVLGLLSGPFLAFFGTLGSLFTLNPLFIITSLAMVVIMIVNAVLLFTAFKPLQNREMKGWVLLFWSDILGIVGSVISLLDGNASSLVGTVIGAALALYILFEMKPFYGKAQSAVEKVKKATT